MNSTGTESIGLDSVSAPDHKLLTSGLARTLSLFLSIVFCLALLMFPQWVIHDGASPGHGPLLLGMLGMAAGFVHGVGYIPRNRFFRIVLGPLTAWILIPLGSWLILS
jgi:predicted membrane protein